MTEELTHVTDGTAQLVDVGHKADSQRRAVATGVISLASSTIEAVEADTLEKGDVLTTARIAAVQAVKQTWATIPLCHQIPISNIETDLTLESDHIRLTVAVETTGKTGCEMEALQGVTTGLNTIWDMVKAAEKTSEGTYQDTSMQEVTVLEKSVVPVDED